MLRDAKTASIAERQHRPPLGGDTVFAAKAAGIGHFFRSPWARGGNGKYKYEASHENPRIRALLCVLYVMEMEVEEGSAGERALRLTPN